MNTVHYNLWFIAHNTYNQNFNMPYYIRVANVKSDPYVDMSPYLL